MKKNSDSERDSAFGMALTFSAIFAIVKKLNANDTCCGGLRFYVNLITAH